MMENFKRIFAEAIGDPMSSAKFKTAIEKIKSSNGDKITDVLNFIYSVVGVVAVAFIVMGAVKYLTSEGEPTKIKQAHQTITFAIIGLLVVLIAAAITNFVTNAVNSASIGILVGEF